MERRALVGGLVEGRAEGEGGRDLTEVLVHGVGVLGPRLEVVLVRGEFFLEGLNVGGVFVEEDLYV